MNWKKIRSFLGKSISFLIDWYFVTTCILVAIGEINLSPGQVNFRLLMLAGYILGCRYIKPDKKYCCPKASQSY